MQEFAEKSVSKQSKQSLFHDIQQVQQQVLEQEVLPLPEHLQKLNLQEITAKTINRLKQSNKISWDRQFRSRIDVQVMQTNFQSLRIMLHYGNFKLSISMIYTQIEEQKIIENASFKGSFGVVKFVEHQGQKYVVKGVNFETDQYGIDSESVYKEYFLAVLADNLKVGPQVVSLFGYDLVLTKKMVLFAMEQCTLPPPQQNKIFEKQMIENLQTMHSVRFIHRDIKPTNVAYSNFRKKYIFIDFGLSDIISQPPGAKTKTDFKGTLSYCSEELKKCYFFSNYRPVDLYENDLCCLKKTFRALGYQFFKPKSLNFDLMPEKMQVNPLEQILPLLRLKYHIETQNISEIITALKKVIYKSSVYQIFQNSHIPKSISENQQIQKKLKAVKERIFSPESKQNKLDSMFSGFFCQSKKIFSTQKIIPISQIVKSQKHIFSRYLAQPTIVLKLFHFFQPFSIHKFYQAENNKELKKIFFKKLYEIKEPKISGSVFFSEKVRFVLIYFYEKLKYLKNVKILICLRLLFISIEDWAYAGQLQKQIISFIDQPFLKMLKMTEFILYKAVLLQGFVSQTQEWAKQIQVLYLNPHIPRQQKIKSFLSMVMVNFRAFNSTCQQKISAMRQINQISSQCCSVQEKQSIYNIKYIYMELCKLHYSAFKQEAPKGLAIKICSQNFNSLKVQLTSLEQEEERLFWPTRREFEFESRQKISEEFVRVACQNQIKLLQERNQPFVNFIQKVLSLKITNKKCLNYCIEKMKKDLANNQSFLDFFQATNWFVSINYCLKFIFLHEKNVKEQEKIMLKSQKIYYINELQQIFNQIVQNLNTNPTISESPQLQLDIMIIQAKLDFQKGKTLLQMQEQISQIAKLIKSFNQEYPNLVLHFLALYNYLRPSLWKNRDHYSRDILLLIGQEYIGKKRFELFQKLLIVLCDFIRLKNQLKKYDETLEIILKLMDYFREKKQVFSKKASNEIFLYATDIFRYSVEPQKLIEIYLEIKAKKFQYKCGFHAYFIFTIFLMVIKQISLTDQKQQVFRTTICLGNMAQICQIKVRPELLKLNRELVKIKSKRKDFIFLRKQAIIIASQIKRKLFVRELKNKIQKINRKNMQELLLKLNQKLSRFAKIATVNSPQ